MYPPYMRVESRVEPCSQMPARLEFRRNPKSKYMRNGPQSLSRPCLWLTALLVAAVTLCPRKSGAQQVEPTLPISQRQTINLAAGVPQYIGDASSTSNAPQSNWWFENTNNSATYSTPGFVESSDTNATWTQVGLPYDANIPRTFINQTSGTTEAEIVAINSGGPAVSDANGGDASFVADEYYSGGGTSANNNVINTSGVANAAPSAVYHSERNGTFTYTIPGLAPGAQYTVLLHFAETYFTAVGQRVFKVAINGTNVLSDFDIYAEAGANTALVEQFNARANANGQIVIAYTDGTANQPKSSGIEIRGTPSACTLVPAAAPAGLTAAASSPSIINLS